MSDSILIPIATDSSTVPPLATAADVHPALRASFVALPSTPGAKFTSQQLAAIAGGRNVESVLRDILRIGLRVIEKREREAEAMHERAA